MAGGDRTVRPGTLRGAHRPVFATLLSSFGHVRGSGHRPLTRELRGFSPHPQAWVSPTKLSGFSSQTHSHALSTLRSNWDNRTPVAGPSETAEEHHEAMDSPAFRRGHRGHAGPLRHYRGRPSLPTTRARRMEVARRPEKHRSTVATPGPTGGLGGIRAERQPTRPAPAEWANLR